MRIDVAIHPRFLKDEQGKRKAVVLSIEEFEAICELVEDRLDAEAFDRAVAESSGEFTDLDEVLEEMKRDGLL